MLRGAPGSRTICCDYCDRTQQCFSYDFKDALSEWKASGWRVFKNKNNGKWMHICEACRTIGGRVVAALREDGPLPTKPTKPTGPKPFDPDDIELPPIFDRKLEL